MAPVMTATSVRGFAVVAPALLTLLTLLFLRIALSYSTLGAMVPLLGLMFTCHFRLYFPKTAPLFFLFTLGLLEDFLTSGVLGLTSFLLVLLAALFEKKHALFRSPSFLREILIFAVFSFGFNFIYWAVAGYIEETLLPVVPFLIQATVTAVTFPVYVWLITRCSWQLRR